MGGGQAANRAANREDQRLSIMNYEYKRRVHVGVAGVRVFRTIGLRVYDDDDYYCVHGRPSSGVLRTLRRHRIGWKSAKEPNSKSRVERGRVKDLSGDQERSGPTGDLSRTEVRLRVQGH
jgi:hypothetical protein